MSAPTLTPPTGAQMAAAVLSARVGPMRTKNGRYCDAERTYQRVSNLLKEIETDTWNLDEWRENMLAIGLSMRSDLVLGVAAAAQFDPVTGKLTTEAKSTLRGLRKQALDAAKSKAGANTGTAVHTATERLDLGESVESIGLPAPYDADLRAYEALKQAMRLTFRPEHVERSVRNKTTDNVGTFDRLGECGLLVERGVLAPGELLVVDVKTEGDPLRNMIHIGPQLAEYANSDDMFVPEPRPATDADPNGPFAGRYEPMPPVSKLVGLMIHVRDGRAVPYLVDLTAGWDGAQAAAAQRDRMKASKTPLGNPGAWAMLVPVDLPQPPERPGYEQLVADAAARGPMGFSAPAGMTPAQYVATADLPRSALAAAVAPELAAMGNPVAQVVEQSYRGADGLVRWAPIEQVRPELDKALAEAGNPLVRMLADQIDVAPDLARLGELYELAVANGVEWSSTIAYLGERRRMIVECVQRELHVGTGLCACGWTQAQQP
jgi:hypothetical protein